MRLFFLLVVGLTITQLSLAQQPNISNQNASPKITGTLSSPEGEMLSYASVVLHNATDSAFVGGTATDDFGKFELPAKSGEYYLKLSFLAYQTKIIPNIKIKDKDIELGEIELSLDAQGIDEIVVKGEKNLMELKLDKRVFNVSKDLQNKGRNAAEILDDLPSITLDVDGNVSLRGSQNVRILIDGKPSGMIGMRSPDALRQLMGNMIERIEVITNPSARYDAEGEVGIINIVLKKEKRDGVNGSFVAHVGYPENFGAGFNVNFRKGIINVFTGYSIYYRKRPGMGYGDQTFTYPDTSFRYTSDRSHVRGGLGHNAKLGANLYLSKYDMITFSGTYNYSRGNNKATLIYTDYDINDIQTGVVTRAENEIEGQQNIDIDLSYQRTFKKKEQKFTIDLQYSDRKDLETADILESGNSPDYIPLLQRTDNTENSVKWLFQTDYIHPFGKEGKIEAGAKIDLRTIDNDYRVEQQDSAESWAVLGDFDNRMLYTENIYAAYVMAGNKWGKFSAQAGLRLEFSDVTTNLVETNEVNSRRYFNFFPSAHLSYELPKKHFLQLSYSRRISRPRFWWLVPFVGFSDTRTFYSGNPDLNPEYTHSFELGHLKYWEKGSMLSSVYYRHTTGMTERILVSDTMGRTNLFPVNLGTENSFGVELSGSYNPFDWWTVSASANFFRSIGTGSYEGISLNSDTYGWTTKMKTKWTIKKKFHIQLSFDYRSPKQDAQGKDLSRYALDGGMSLDILKGNGSLVFNARDIFNSRKRRSITYGEDFYYEGEFQWRSRTFMLTFTYRLNQKKPKGGREGNWGGNS